MLIREITKEIKIDRNRSLELLTWATDSPYTAKKDKPKITAVTVKVKNFLHSFCPFVRPMLPQMISSGSGALSIERLSDFPWWLKSKLLPLLAQVMKFLNREENYFGFNSTIRFFAKLESKVTKKTGFWSLTSVWSFSFISSLSLITLAFWASMFYSNFLKKASFCSFVWLKEWLDCL